MTTASSVGGATGRAGSAAGERGECRRRSRRIATPSSDRPREPHRDRAVRLAAIAFIVAWLALGLEIASLGAALVVGFEVVLRALADDAGAPVAEHGRRGSLRPTAEPVGGAQRRATGQAPTGGLELLDPDRRRLELGRAGLRVGRVDRQQVRRDVVLEVERHERQPGPQRLVDPDRRLDLAAPRDDPDALALGQAVGRGVLGRDVERLAAPQRRGVAGGLDAGVVRVEAAAGRQADREVVVELVDRRVVVDRHERHAVARAPGPPRAGCGGTARPGGSRRSTATGARRAPRAARSSSRRGPATGGGPRPRRPRRRRRPSRAPIRSASSKMIPRSSRRPPGGSTRLAHALDAPLGVRDGALALGPGRGRRQDDVGELGGRGQEDVLDDEEVEARRAGASPASGRPRTGPGSRRCSRRPSGRRAPSRRTSPTGASRASAGPSRPTRRRTSPGARRSRRAGSPAAGPGRAPMSPPPWTLFWPRSGLTPLP